MDSQLQGRLELTWTNKHKRLLATQDGTYQWVSSSDYRVAEVRLLKQVEQFGVESDDNLLIEGDSLYALQSLTSLPELSKQYLGNVKLAYIDPPFNTQQTFEQYDDALEHSVWLTMMRDRLRLIRDMLRTDGSVWVHCDDSEQHRLRCVLDEVFGSNNFVATVIWQKKYASANDHKSIAPMHDFILVYRRSESFQRNLLPRTEEKDRQYRFEDDRGIFRPDNYTCNKTADERPNLYYPVVNPNTEQEIWPKRSAVWRYSKERHEFNIANNLIYWGKDGRSKVPAFKRYRDDLRGGGGIVPNTWWTFEFAGHTDEAKKEVQNLNIGTGRNDFATPKPERLMQRIVHIASNPGDIVLDCFAGSGTTAAVAHKMERRWVTVEWSADTLERYVIPRLQKVIAGEDSGGITEAVSWQGGGGFRHVQVGPSMFDEVGDRIVLADWATNGQLARATAAQLGFEYEEVPPFCGKKGKQRLAVVDGMVNMDVIEILVQRLQDDETLVLCGTAVDLKARSALRKLRPGSTIRKIPSGLLSGFRHKPSVYEIDPPSVDISLPDEAVSKISFERG